MSLNLFFISSKIFHFDILELDMFYFNHKQIEVRMIRYILK